MAKVETSYAIADKRYRYLRKILFSDAWIAGGQRSWELSVLPAGEYLERIYFSLEGVYRQDGNGDDAITSMDFLNILDMIEITNGSNTHLRGALGLVAQDFKQLDGANCLLPDDIAASSGASNVDTPFAMLIPFAYSNPAFYRPDDSAYPTSLLQDGNLTIHWNNDESLVNHASSEILNASVRIIAVTSRLNRATIPAEVEVGYISSGNLDFRLPRGNYQRVWIANQTKAQKVAQVSIYAEADGLEVIASGTRMDELEALCALDCGWHDDNAQVPLQGDVLDLNVPPIGNCHASESWEWSPIYFGLGREKLAKILRVENAFNFQLAGASSSKIVCFRRYKSHTESGLDARAKIMGFGPNSAALPRTNRRKLGPGDMSLANLLPVRLVQGDPV